MWLNTVFVCLSLLSFFSQYACSLAKANSLRSLARVKNPSSIETLSTRAYTEPSYRLSPLLCKSGRSTEVAENMKKASQDVTPVVGVSSLGHDHRLSSLYAQVSFTSSSYFRTLLLHFLRCTIFYHCCSYRPLF